MDNPLSFAQKFRSAEETRREDVGTPEAPVNRDHPVKTGSNARRSETMRRANWLAKAAGERDKDAFHPLNSRSERRAQQRADARLRRKGQRNFTRRQRAKETAAQDLLNLFLLADGAEPASPLHRYRAQQRIAERVALVRGEQQAARDAQVTARQRDRSLSAPPPVDSHEAIRVQLWELAQAATLPKPKQRAAQ